MPTNLTVTGMTCEHCEQSITEALESVDGVENAAVDRTTDLAVVEGTTDTDALISAVEDAGYSVSV